jgi:hypothetical protein
LHRLAYVFRETEQEEPMENGSSPRVLRLFWRLRQLKRSGANVERCLAGFSLVTPAPAHSLGLGNEEIQRCLVALVAGLGALMSTGVSKTAEPSALDPGELSQFRRRAVTGRSLPLRPPIIMTDDRHGVVYARDRRPCSIALTCAYPARFRRYA